MLHPVSPDDYVHYSYSTMFYEGTLIRSVNTSAFIYQDHLCEINPSEYFIFNIVGVNGVPPIEVIRPNATVLIDDTPEPECGEQLFSRIITI